MNNELILIDLVIHLVEDASKVEMIIIQIAKFVLMDFSSVFGELDFVLEKEIIIVLVHLKMILI